MDSERSRMLNNFAELSLDLLMVAEVQSMKFRWVSPNWHDVLGWSLEELYGMTYQALVHPDDFAAANSIANRQVTEGTVIKHCQTRWRTRNGEWRWLEWNSTPDDDGFIYGVGRDITETKQRDLESQELNQLLSLASEVGGIGYWRLDLRTLTLTWSDEMYRIHGLEPGASAPPSLAESLQYVHPEDRPTLDRALGAFATAETSYEYRIVTAQGEPRTLVCRGRIKTDPENPDHHVVFGTLRDATEQRAMQDRLYRSERLAALGTLAAGVAHEINNPLTYVLGNLGFLAEELVSNPNQHKMALDALQGAEHVRRIVEGLRSFSRINDACTRETIPADALLAAALELADHAVSKHATTISTTGSLPSILGERVPLVQVLTNVLLNAAQAIEDPELGEICIRASVQGDRVVFDIEDNGPGISKDHQPHIFDPFFTTKPVGEGTGLGLSICLGTVQAHGGSLELVESQPGKTVFRMALPIHRGERTEAGTACATPSAPESDEPPAFVFAIDDDRLVSGMIVRALRMHQVEQLDGAAQALARLQEGARPDLILCDLMMPGMAGWDFERALQQTFPDLLDRVVYMTGGAMSEKAERFLDALPEGRKLFKPFAPSKLRTLVQRD